MKKLSKKIEKILDNHGFNYSEIQEQDGQFYIDLNNDTPCGEDWWETIWFDGTNEGFCQAVRDRYNNFDVDEEVEPYIEIRGQNGVPGSISELLEDAEWKEKTLEELSIDLFNEVK